MNVIGIIAHIGLLIHLGKDVNGIVQNLVAKKETWPSNDEFVKLLDDAADLLTSGLLSLPDNVVKAMLDAIAQVKAQLMSGAVAQKAG